MVTEKPSVARDLARVLGARTAHPGWFEGEGLRITWCVGHLLELEEPATYDERWKRWALDTLPILPDRFRLRVRKGVEDVWRTVRAQLRDPGLGEVINACDAGREGELIFRQVYAEAGAKAPVLRFWTSSLTDEAVRSAWGALQPASRFDPLGDAARCRSEADWLVGMNATRAMTCRTRDAGGDALWSVGRVQTPTLAMICARDAAIEAFVPETYWTVRATFHAEAGTFGATWFRRDVPEEERRGPDAEEEARPAERLSREEDAQAIVRAARGREGRVVAATRRARREPPPLLYDLTSLQRRANQRYGLSAQRTLEIAQALYERHKLITYPRTDARHLTSDQIPELPGMLRGLAGLDVYRPFAEALLAGPLRPGPRVVDDAEVGDHHAIVPTGRTPEAGRLAPDEKRVFDLVARRLLAALSPEARIELCELVVEVPPDPAVVLPADVVSPLVFRARGRVVQEEGWMAVDPPGRSRDVDLPRVVDGDLVRGDPVEASHGETRPPRPHDDATLLRGMETAGRTLEEADLARALRNAGLGTPATRAAILQTLLDRGYVTREGRALRATRLGRALIAALPVEALKSAELTGRWEKRLADVAEGREAGPRFFDDVVGWVRALVDELRVAELGADAGLRRPADGPVLGTCPLCGGKVAPVGKVYRCDGPGCALVLFDRVAGRKLVKRQLQQLLRDGRLEPQEGFTSKAGKPFTAGLELRDGRVQLWFPDRGPGVTVEAVPSLPAEAPRAPPAPMPGRVAVGEPCPTCRDGTVIRGRAALGCSRWRDGCNWRGPLPEEPR